MTLLRVTISTFVLAICISMLLGFSATYTYSQIMPPQLPSLTAEPLGSTNYKWMLKDLNGKNVSLSQFKGKTIFIQVWSTWCGVCMHELPSSQQLWNSLRGRDDIAFLFVSIDDDTDLISKFMNKRGLDFPAFLRVERSKEFKDDKLPSTFIVDQTGRILVRHFGSANWDDSSVRDYLLAIANKGKSVK